MVVNIIVLAVWAVSNSSLYKGCQLFLFASDVCEIEKTTIMFCTTGIIQWYLEENSEYAKLHNTFFDAHMIKDSGWKNHFGAGLLNHQSSIFNIFFMQPQSFFLFLTKKLISWEGSRVSFVSVKSFLWCKMLRMKSANLWVQKNIVCVKWIGDIFFSLSLSLFRLIAKNAGKVQQITGFAW